MPEISVHDWLEVIGAVFAAGGFYQMMRNLKTDVGAIKQDLQKLNQVMMTVALNEQRQTNFENMTNERIKELKDAILDIKHRS
jgi:hypothetical protein